jgi:energy-coupling factor transport system permease protein
VTTSISLYIAGDSGLHRLYPTTKLLLALALILSGFTIPVSWASYAIFLGIILPISVWGGIWKQLIRAVWKIVLPLAISIFLIQGLFWGSGTVLFYIGPLSIYKDGIVFAIASVGRILLVIGSFLLLAMTTRPDLLMNSLTKLGIPGAITYIVVTTIQIIPRFQAKAATIVDAQRSRGMITEGNILQRARALTPLVLPLVLSSLVDVEERAIAIEARAFNAPGLKTMLIDCVDTQNQRFVRYIMIFMIILMLGFRLWWSLISRK